MASFGEELRRQRELRAVSLREISDATKINIRFLEALEENDFKHLPGGQFNKGFIRAYSRHIGVSGEEMVDSYLLELRGQEEGGGSRRVASTRGPSRWPRPRALLGVALLLLVILLAAGVSWLLLRSRTNAPRGGSHVESAPTRLQGAPSETASGAGEDTNRGTGPEGSIAVPVPSVSQESSPSAPPPVPEGSREPSVPANTQGPSGATTERPSPEGEERGKEPAPPRAGTSAESGAASSTGAPSTAPPSTGRVPTEAPSSATPQARPVPEVGEELVLRIIPFQPVKFGLRCGGKELYSGLLAAGNALKFQCTGVYEVTLDDAGAVSMSVNGERIYLGRPGQSIAGRHVSAENYLDFVKPPSEVFPR